MREDRQMKTKYWNHSTPEEILDFYKSKQWIKVRNAKRAISHYTCEKCGMRGQEVHHIIPLTIENYQDPNISLNLDNLMLLCKSCHDAIRSGEAYKREDVTFDEKGNVNFIKKNV